MTILVGYGPEARGRGGLELARTLSLSASLPLVVCCVIPDRWQSVGPGRQVDRDYDSYLHGLAHAALGRAAEALGPIEAGVSLDVETARSAPAGLLDAAERHGARLLVAGSSADGAWGHVALGSVTDRLLHSSHIPVALAPRGYRRRRTSGWTGSRWRWTGPRRPRRCSSGRRPWPWTSGPGCAW